MGLPIPCCMYSTPPGHHETRSLPWCFFFSKGNRELHQSSPYRHEVSKGALSLATSLVWLQAVSGKTGPLSMWAW